MRFSGEAVKLDIRIPIGLLFTLIGALLAGYGLLNGAPMRGAAAGFNINAGWGAVPFDPEENCPR